MKKSATSKTKIEATNILNFNISETKITQNLWKQNKNKKLVTMEKLGHYNKMNISF